MCVGWGEANCSVSSFSIFGLAAFSGSLNRTLIRAAASWASGKEESARDFKKETGMDVTRILDKCTPVHELTEIISGEEREAAAPLQHQKCDPPHKHSLSRLAMGHMLLKFPTFEAFSATFLRFAGE